MAYSQRQSRVNARKSITVCVARGTDGWTWLFQGIFAKNQHVGSFDVVRFVKEASHTVFPCKIRNRKGRQRERLQGVISLACYTWVENVVLVVVVRICSADQRLTATPLNLPTQLLTFLFCFVLSPPLALSLAVSLFSLRFLLAHQFLRSPTTGRWTTLRYSPLSVRQSRPHVSPSVQPAAES